MGTTASSETAGGDPEINVITEEGDDVSLGAPSLEAQSAVLAVEAAMGIEYEHVAMIAPSAGDHAFWNWWFERCVAECQLLAQQGVVGPVEYPPAWPPHSLLMPGDDRSFTSVVSVLASAILRTSLEQARNGGQPKGVALEPTGSIEVRSHPAPHNRNRRLTGPKLRAFRRWLFKAPAPLWEGASSTTITAPAGQKPWHGLPSSASPTAAPTPGGRPTTLSR